MISLRRARARLLAWYARNKRDLPWRRTSDPYAIWVSEAMLQQTQVATVLPYYERFLERFPDLPALAAAEDDEVLAMWSGLGYYRRARSLRDGARAVCERHGGRVPGDPEALRALPGIGRYTAGAIASLAFGREEPVLDGNVRRVLSRWTGRRTKPGNAGDAPLWELAARLVRGPSPGDLNQALMELGARVCTPRSPGCGACPLAEHCVARLSGDPEAFPERRPGKRAQDLEVAIAVIVHRGRVLVEPRSPRSPLRGAWDLPAVELKRRALPDRILRDIRNRHGVECAVVGILPGPRHSILDKRLRLQVVLARARSRGTKDRVRWLPLADIAESPVSSATTKCVRLATPYLQNRIRAPESRRSAASGRANA